MSHSLELTGVVVHVGQPEQITDTFSKRDLILKIDGETQYPQEIKMQAANEKMDKLNGLGPGARITVGFNMRGSSYNRKSDGKKDWFLNLNIWRVEVHSNTAGASQAEPQGAASSQQAHDDVPF